MYQKKYTFVASFIQKIKSIYFEVLIFKHLRNLEIFFIKIIWFTGKQEIREKLNWKGALVSSLFLCKTLQLLQLILNYQHQIYCNLGGEIQKLSCFLRSFVVKSTL